MGLTVASTGRRTAETEFTLQRRAPDDLVIALAGNPNVGKSTLFNTLTGANQHTGNWPGKTVSTAQGHCTYRKQGYVFVDLPGTYSLMAHSAEEEVARDFLLSGDADAVVVVCDATCLERNLNLVLQTMEITSNVLVCVNLLDEARRKGLTLDLEELELRLGVPVVGTSAGRNVGLDAFMERLSQLAKSGNDKTPALVLYPAPLEEALSILEPEVAKQVPDYPSRWYALRLLDSSLPAEAAPPAALSSDLAAAQRQLEAAAYTPDTLTDAIVSGLVRTAEKLSHGIVSSARTDHDRRDRRLDRLFTSRLTGIPIMLLLLTGILWLTIIGANYPSELLSRLLFWVQEKFSDFLVFLGSPEWLRGLLADGAFRVLAWVVSVMLPPMAIFFPLFTLLEDFGYLPRVAFNLDHAFQKAKTCGKQALTMRWYFSRMPRAASLFSYAIRYFDLQSFPAACKQGAVLQALPAGHKSAVPTIWWGRRFT